MGFDQHAETYQEAVDRAASVSVEKLAGEKARMILKVLSDCVDDPKHLNVLDIGCGIGLVDQDLDGGVAELWGVDTSLHSLKFARGRTPGARFVHYDGERLPFADSSFDAVFASCVLHHVPPASRRGFLTEMLRPLRPRGAIIVIEHNPLNPVTRRVVSRCAFDADAVLLSCRETMRLITEAGAPIAGRRYVGFSPFRNALVEQAEQIVSWLPIGAQYCVWGIKSSQG
jgi:ubiquinone/menaquinone biosynthesis C-methylase UbiE